MFCYQIVDMLDDKMCIHKPCYQQYFPPCSLDEERGSLVSGIWYMASDIWLLFLVYIITGIWYLAFLSDNYIWHLISDNLFLASDIWNLKTGIWYLAFSICIWYLVSYCIFHLIWHLTSKIRCTDNREISQGDYKYVLNEGFEAR